MREIKFTTNYEKTLSFNDENFKTKYEERVGNNPSYVQAINGERKHLAVCPRCNNPVVILGVYKKINQAAHARHTKETDIPGVASYNEDKYMHCPYHRKSANYVMEYIPETEESQRKELYKIAKEHYDKAIYLLQKETGIYITLKMAEDLAKNYTAMRVYNYIDATLYNVPWYLLYSFSGFPLYHLVIRKKTTLHKHLTRLGISLKDSKIEGCVYVENNEGYLLTATNYRYTVDKNDNLNEWLDFSILRQDNDITETLLYIPVDRFSISVDSYHFGNLVDYKDWKPRKNMLDIAKRYMNP